MTTRPPLLPDDPDAPPSDAEIEAAESLRRALDDPGIPHEGADLARAVALAHAPRSLDPAAHRALVEGALARRDARGGRLIQVSFGLATGLALAAGVAMVVGSVGAKSASHAAAATAAPPFHARSTQPLFDEPFSVSAGEQAKGSAHVDRIATARASDYRDNRFSRWGAR